jgi:mRNA-degrading endonuclease toxin of MazEF toxin-antitoxin module
VRPLDKLIIAYYDIIKIHTGVEIPSGTAGLRSLSKVMVNQTRAVDKLRLLKKLGHFPEESIDDINQALKLHYELE